MTVAGAMPVAFVADVGAEPISLAGAHAALPMHGAASTRLRALIPARALAVDRTVHLVPPRMLSTDPALSALGPLDAVIVGKLVSIADLVRVPQAADGLLGRLRATAGRHPLIADVCDHLPAQGESEGSAAPRQLVEGLGEVAHLTVPTEALRAALAPFARRGISVVEDPYEGARGEPRGPRHGDPARVVWFGLVTGESARPLVAGLEALARRPIARRLSVEIVANASAARGLAGLARTLDGRLPIALTPWTPDAVGRALAGADLALLPQDTAAAWTRAKSHNRLVETIRAGRFAVAAPIPAYRELADFAWVGEDLAAGVEWALDHPVEAAARVAAGQAAIERRFAPAVVAERWMAAIAAARSAR